MTYELVLLFQTMVIDWTVTVITREEAETECRAAIEAVGDGGCLDIPGVNFDWELDQCINDIGVNTRKRRAGLGFFVVG